MPELQLEPGLLSAFGWPYEVLVHNSRASLWCEAPATNHVKRFSHANVAFVNITTLQNNVGPVLWDLPFLHRRWGFALWINKLEYKSDVFIWITSGKNEHLSDIGITEASNPTLYYEMWTISYTVMFWIGCVIWKLHWIYNTNFCANWSDNLKSTPEHWILIIRFQSFTSAKTSCLHVACLPLTFIGS